MNRMISLVVKKANGQAGLGQETKRLELKRDFI